MTTVKDTTLDMRVGKSSVHIKFNDVDPVKREADLNHARYLLSQAGEALTQVMRTHKEVAEEQGS